MRSLLGTIIAVSALATLSWVAMAGHTVKGSRSGSGNLPPECCIAPGCIQSDLLTVECTGDETVFILDATASYDPEGQPLTFIWTACPNSTIDDPTSPLTTLRIDTSSSCDQICGVRLYVGDGVNLTHCRLYVQVIPAKGGCTYTQGYWKNHGPVGCQSGNNSNAWPATSLDLGNTTYTDYELCSIFKTPVSGNGLISLAHQLIAAKLNAANGATLPTVAADAISNADLLIGNLVVPPVGGDSLSPATTSFLVGVLTMYNEGKLEGTVHCE